MAISIYQTSETRCPICRTSFEADFWLIVDAQEKPDMWKKCLDGEIHFITCPDGHSVLFSAPLLLHDGKRKHLSFVPPPDVTEEEIERMLSRLMQSLLSSLPLPVRHDTYLTRVEFLLPFVNAYRGSLMQPVNGGPIIGGDHREVKNIKALLHGSEAHAALKAELTVFAGALKYEQGMAFLAEHANTVAEKLYGLVALYHLELGCSQGDFRGTVSTLQTRMKKREGDLIKVVGKLSQWSSRAVIGWVSIE